VAIPKASDHLEAEAQAFLFGAKLAAAHDLEEVTLLTILSIPNHNS